MSIGSAPLICWSFSSPMFKYLLLDHAVPAQYAEAWQQPGWGPIAYAELFGDRPVCMGNYRMMKRWAALNLEHRAATMLLIRSIADDAG
jgi:hypothetical protein